MKLVARVKLLASCQQKQVLLATLKKANQACNRMSEHAWENKCFKQFDLHKACYHNIREEFGLASQLIIRCNAKVADSYKLDKLTKRTKEDDFSNTLRWRYCGALYLMVLLTPSLM